VYHGLLTPFVFFVVGCVVGDWVGFPPLPAGLIVSLAGAFFTKEYAARHPKWVRGSW